MLPRFSSNEPGTREEEVQVDERAGDREEDLLHEVGRERPGERRAGMIATNIISVTKVPMFAGRKLFIATPDRIGGHDRPELDLARVGGAQDAVVREPGEHRLARLEDERGDDVADRDGLDLIPEVRQPAA